MMETSHYTGSSKSLRLLTTLANPSRRLRGDKFRSLTSRPLSCRRKPQQPFGRKPMLALILLIFTIVFVSVIAAPPSEPASATSSRLASSTSASPLEILRDWRALAVLAIMTSLILVALGYMFGHATENPELEAWAKNEMVQVFANLLIVIALAATMLLIDTTAYGMVQDSGVPAICNSGPDGCLKNVSIAYISDYISAATDEARGVVTDNMRVMASAGRRAGVNCNVIYCGYVGVNMPLVAYYILDNDRNMIVFEYYSNLIGSLEAQLFFVKSISLTMGPLILALGLVARAFFFSRKLGGLLIAIAAGVMFFFPGMYLFNWITLDNTVNGDKSMDSDNIFCPADCAVLPPLAYVDTSSGPRPLTSASEVNGAFSAADAAIAIGILRGSTETGVASNVDTVPAAFRGRTVHSCNFGEAAGCPTLCREVPYPVVGKCTNLTRFNITPGSTVSNVRAKCSQVPDPCLVVRRVNLDSPDFNRTEYEVCPSACKIVPPLNPNCNDNTGPYTGCRDSRYDCRSTLRSDLRTRPLPSTTAGGDKYAQCVAASRCPASLNANENCVYVFPETGPCETMCTGCPQYCRIEGASLSNLPSDCINTTRVEGVPSTDSPRLIVACQTSKCEVCKIRMNDITRNAGEGVCTGCAMERRIITTTDLPESYSSGSCSYTNCPIENRTSIPRNGCEMCLFSESTYLYDPPVRTDCTSLCKPPNNVPVKDAGSYLKIGEDGLVGPASIQALSQFMIPAYLLPLFDIVATLVFIKGLSGILGGDIEVPGMSKVF